MIYNRSKRQKRGWCGMSVPGQRIIEKMPSIDPQPIDLISSLLPHLLAHYQSWGLPGQMVPGIVQVFVLAIVRIVACHCRFHGVASQQVYEPQ